MDVLRTLMEQQHASLHPRIIMTWKVRCHPVVSYLRWNICITVAIWKENCCFNKTMETWLWCDWSKTNWCLFRWVVHPYGLSLSMRPSRQRILLPPPKNPKAWYKRHLVFGCSKQNYHINIAKMLCIWSGILLALILSKDIQATIPYSTIMLHTLFNLASMV